MFMENSCKIFMDNLASSSPIPGGGSACAMVGALGASLGSMVGNLTLGKKKYAEFQEDIKNLLIKTAKLQSELIELVERDAEVFEPLSKAYGLPKNTVEEKLERDKVMEESLKLACSVPLEIMRKSLEAIDLHEEFAKKGTRIAISDVGVGVLFCQSALKGAGLNVFINTKLMKDTNYANSINKEADKMLALGIKKADSIYNEVEKIIKITE